MAYDINLANQVREYLAESTSLQVNEKTMFGGIAFLVDDKMCINVSGERLMCRIDPAHSAELGKRVGVQPMVMRGKILDGYCLVDYEGYKDRGNLKFWIDVCLEYNPSAQKSKRR